MKVWRYLPFLFVLVACGGNGSSDTTNLAGNYQVLIACTNDEYQVYLTVDEEGQVTGNGQYISHLQSLIPIPNIDVEVTGGTRPVNLLDLDFVATSPSMGQHISFHLQATNNGFTGTDAEGGTPEGFYTLTATKIDAIPD